MRICVHVGQSQQFVHKFGGVRLKAQSFPIRPWRQQTHQGALAEISRPWMTADGTSMDATGRVVRFEDLQETVDALVKRALEKGAERPGVVDSTGGKLGS